MNPFVRAGIFWRADFRILELEKRTRRGRSVLQCPRCRLQPIGARQRLAATPHPLFLQRTLVSRKRAKIGARAGPIWHYVALRGTRAPPTCTRTCAFEGPLGSPRRAIQPSSREKTAHDLRVGELQWPPEDGENVTNRTVNAPLKAGQNAEVGNAAVRAASGERAARARLPITVIDRQSLGEALAWWRKSYAT